MTINKNLTRKGITQNVILCFFTALFKPVIFLDLPSNNKKNVIIGENVYQLYERFLEMFEYNKPLAMSRRSFYTKFGDLLNMLGFEIEKEKGNTGVKFTILNYSDLVDFDNFEKLKKTINEAELSLVSSLVSLDNIKDKESPAENIADYLQTIASLKREQTENYKNDKVDAVYEKQDEQIPIEHEVVNFCDDYPKNQMILENIANKLCIESGLAQRLLKLFYGCASDPSKDRFSHLYYELIKNISS